jgi:chromosome segregation ATPase
MEKSIEDNNKATLEDGKRMKDLERRLEDLTTAKDDLQTQHEKLIKKHEELDGKYNEQLKANLKLTQDATTNNEELLKLREAKQIAEEGLKKAKRMAKITVSI